MSTHTPFGDTFDSIDAASAPTRDAIERAMARVSPALPEEPGFYLLDDAQGRFVVDRALGIVSLRDASILGAEHGSVHAARLLVIEPSGTHYEMELKLRLTGPVPKMVGAEDIDFLGGAAPLETPPPPRRTTQWSAYSAAESHATPAHIDEDARFGSAVAQPLPFAARGPYQLHLFTPLPPHADKGAAWSL